MFLIGGGVYSFTAPLWGYLTDKKVCLPFLKSEMLSSLLWLKRVFYVKLFIKKKKVNDMASKKIMLFFLMYNVYAIVFYIVFEKW